METNEADIKGHLMGIIQKAEEMAKDTIEISLKQDLFEIDKLAIDFRHYKRLLGDLITQTVNRYANTRNFYKASNEQFDFLNSEIRNADSKELDNNDRLDFIATILNSYLDWEPEDKQGIEEKLEAVVQIENLEAIVFETRTLELKKNAFLRTLQKMKEGQQSQPQHQDVKDKPAWFQVGLLFATGQLEELMKEHSYNSTKVAKKLFENAWGKYRPYLSESYSNTTASDKNIFSSLKKVKSIRDYCEDRGIAITDERFLTT